MKAMGDMTAQLLPDIGKSGGGYESDWAEHELTNSEKVSDEGEVQVVVYVKPEVEIDTSSQPYKEEASMGYPVERRSIPDVAADVADGGLDPKYNLSSLKMPSCSEWWQMTDPQQTGASSGNEPTSSQNRNGTDERQSNGTSTGKQTIDTPANSHPEAEFREEAMDVLERMELLVGKRGVVM
ncbi:hypothetical protein [Endozoicomonas sp.]|uniref:hypothetical protein n=1 Tax=Endozoicomonas sp. TaxID=1892382 RepID=UPI002884C687|nr:hypothetical protein [Endozoicomonas sp.]